MQRLLPSDSQYQTRSLCRMEMQRSMPSKIKQPDMKTKDKPTKSKTTTSPERETCWSWNNRSIYFSLTYSQSPYNRKSLNCYLQKTPRWRVSTTEGASDTLQIRYLYRSAFEGTPRWYRQRQLCDKSASILHTHFQTSDIHLEIVLFCLFLFGKAPWQHSRNRPHSEQDLLAT